MFSDPPELSVQAWLWIASGMLVLLAAGAAFAEHRRTRRRNLDAVGWMPWNLVQVLAGMAAVVAAALALHV